MIEVFTHEVERIWVNFDSVREDFQKEIGVHDFLLVLGALSTLRRTLVRIYASRVESVNDSSAEGGDLPEA